MNPVNQSRVVEQRECIIASACSGLAKDLRVIDPVTYALFFNTGNMSAIYQTVTEFVEQHFAPGTMSFSCTGECVVGWEEPPVVSIDLEFEVDALFAFFRLYLSQKGVAVSLHHISFNESTGDSQSNTRLLEKQLDLASNPITESAGHKLRKSYNR